MKDSSFEVQLNWSGTGRKGEGKITIGQELLMVSGPENMGGKGVGLSPEDLLISAVGSCYSGTLFSLLALKGLPVQRVAINTESTVINQLTEAKFSRLLVHPTIFGGNPALQAEYEKAAEDARENCFIGKTIASNVDYRVGTVRVNEMIVAQEKIDVLVDDFYAKLVKDPYFSNMFAERGVNVEVLKERQRIFISRLINGNPTDGNQSEKEQVQKRHSFSTTPERAEIWLGLMGETVRETDFPESVKENLMEKMGELMKPFVR
ncbi:OsmC family protein [Planococcus lenghuensis]|uniref:Osmotically inducible protein OsmC n=1 Tax=Planococcus lenghuensis TaxID=2213202 RepID=A0A1Q2KW67_9BACL|nr:OsmC family protein [Planococcus lenghuensis]AQQ52366.1 hypothetical protein B0X71_04055 [Planococcus lenghuensis]